MTHSASAHTTAQAGAHALGEDTRDVVVTEDGRVLNDPTHATPAGHGNTPGGWAMAGIVIVGFVLGCIALLADLDVLVWIGSALVALGFLVGIFTAGRGDEGHARH